MKKICAITFSVVMIFISAANAQEKSPYTSGEVELITLPNGSVVNENLINRLSTVLPEKPQVVTLTDGVWSLDGFSISNVGVIEGDTGLIIYDTGNDNDEGRMFLEAIRTVSNKPVIAIIYSHSHYVSGGRALLDGNEDYMIIGHPNLNKNLLESGGRGASIPELAPVLNARFLEQYSSYVPKDGPDAPFTHSPIPSKDKEYVPVTKIVQNEEILEIDGVKMQFFTDYDSDTDDCLMVYLPEKEVVLSNLYWPVYPNLYTLRGSLYRNPIPWMHGLQKIRNLAPEHLINTNAMSASGKEEIRESVILYHDGLAFLYDQTLRRIILGETPQELRHSVKLPDHLTNFPNNQFSYGEQSYYPPNIYYYALGWFNGNTMELNPIHPAIEAERIVEGFGGKDKVISAIHKSSEEKDFAWATQLAGYLVKVYPNDTEVRQLAADQLRSMGQLTEATIPRSWYLGQVNALENKANIVSSVMPSVQDILDSEPGIYIDMMRVRIDPEKSKNTDKVMVMHFTDTKENSSFGLHIRKGVAEFIPIPGEYYKSADITIALPRATFANYYTGQIKLQEMLDDKEVQVNGNKHEAELLLMQFDQPEKYQSNYKFSLK